MKTYMRGLELTINMWSNKQAMVAHKNVLLGMVARSECTMVVSGARTYVAKMYACS